VLENRPHSPEAHCVRGAALHRLGKNREAAKAFNRAERAGAGYFGRHPAMRELYEAAVKETKH